MHNAASPASPRAVALFGAAGYSGLELAPLLARHPAVGRLVCASDAHAGRPIAALTRGFPDPKATFVPVAEALAAAPDDAFLAVPNEAAAELAPRLVAGGARVIDLSGAHRLRDAAAQAAHYKLPLPPFPEGAVRYSLPELRRLDGAARAAVKVLANPGCYATAIALALAPLQEAGLLAGPPVVDAASGVSGAGRKGTEAYSFVELSGDYRGYRALRHQHVPEVREALGLAAPIRFVPHLLPVPRGILVTAHAPLTAAVPAAELLSMYTARFAGEPFVSVVADPEEVRLSRVVGTNRCRLSLVVAEDDGPPHVTVFSAIDNLLKGASGQAVQNYNLLLGLPETTGLEALL